MYPGGPCTESENVLTDDMAKVVVIIVDDGDAGLVDDVGTAVQGRQWGHANVSVRLEGQLVVGTNVV